MRSIVITSYSAGRQALSLDPTFRRLPHCSADTTSRSVGPARRLTQLIAIMGLVSILGACDSDLNTTSVDDDDTPVDADSLPPTGSNGSTSNDLLTLEIDDSVFQLQEGAAAATRIPVSIVRNSGAPATIQLSAELQAPELEPYTTVTFSDAALGANESDTTLSLQLAIGARPILPQSTTLVVTASNGSTPLLSTAIEVSVSPTELPDVYLLVGQSNMVGFSEDDSKRAEPGLADAPNERILQLNVTGNDAEHFAIDADFTDPASNYNEGLPLTPALDPLHDGFDTTLDGKAGQRIGPGLSFAKLALGDTNNDIYLVPAAWADTGFCKRATNRLPGIGWNATPKNNAALSGTLLYERAVERANIALSETNGVLRGILWHQGEGDTDDTACAETYADNLAELAAALRTTIQQDARGAAARGPNADVPFIVGTLSQGSDDRGDMLPFSDAKQLVDDTLRDIASLIPLSGVALTEDLVPPAYPCGEGSCIHFGAAAQREMGQRYYRALTDVLSAN